MNIKDLSKPLTVNQVEFRIQSINNGGYATVLVYKDARADMQRLDEVCGPLGWKREHVNNNANCIVSIWCPDIQQWISKEDTGTESNAEKEKGLASDSFKRACVNWGIGRELYDYPVISIALSGGGSNPKGCEWYKDPSKKDRWGNPSPKQGYNLKLKEWTWFSQFNENGKIVFLSARDNNIQQSGKDKGKGEIRFTWGAFDKELHKQQTESK
tara:strand:- start:1876 stop:2514 length:639 start_codon:yes stop_codon:yes gene_type:complete